MKANKSKFTDATTGLSMGIALVTTVAILFSGCKSNDDDGPDERTPFLGTYTVVATSKAATDIYEITLSKGDGNTINISNFGDFMKVPVKATVSGSNLTIPLQNYTNSGAAIGVDISGSGVLDNDVITGTYTWVLGSYDPVVKDFEATKK